MSGSGPGPNKLNRDANTSIREVSINTRLSVLGAMINNMHARIILLSLRIRRDFLDWFTVRRSKKPQRRVYVLAIPRESVYNNIYLYFIAHRRQYTG